MSEPPGHAPAGSPAATRSGLGTVLVIVYAIFALSASARSGVQLATRFEEAPLAYLLSAFAAGVYVLATIALALGGRVGRVLATLFCGLELVGVLGVGTLSLALPHLFPEATVWSLFGRGYGFVPLVLPVLGLAWLARTRGNRTRINRAPINESPINGNR